MSVPAQVMIDLVLCEPYSLFASLKAKRLIVKGMGRRGMQLTSQRSGEGVF